MTRNLKALFLGGGPVTAAVLPSSEQPGMRQGKARSGRSNMYSESKYSNWAIYDPQQIEANSVSQHHAAMSYTLGNGSVVRLYEVPLRNEFIRPFDCLDVITMLNRIPSDMLNGLSRIALLGGTKRQAKSAWNEHWTYGRYGYGSIYLFAYPKRSLEWPSPKLHSPDQLQAYKRAGVKIVHENGKWIYRFTPESIRRFYLWDVLVHEVGHHVDRFHPDRSIERSERFAEWFARTYGFEAEPSVGHGAADDARHVG